jgi:hypothetical protein
MRLADLAATLRKLSEAVAVAKHDGCFSLPRIEDVEWELLPDGERAHVALRRSDGIAVRVETPIFRFGQDHRAALKREWAEQLVAAAHNWADVAHNPLADQWVERLEAAACVVGVGRRRAPRSRFARSF